MIGLAGLLNDSDLFKIVLCIRKRSKSSFFFFFLFSVLLLHLNSFALSRFIALLLSLSVILFYIYYNKKKTTHLHQCTIAAQHTTHKMNATKATKAKKKLKHTNENEKKKKVSKQKMVLVQSSYFDHFFFSLQLCYVAINTIVETESE